MDNNHERLQALERKLLHLVQQQQQHNEELMSLNNEIHKLRQELRQDKTTSQQPSAQQPAPQTKPINPNYNQAKDSRPQPTNVRPQYSGDNKNLERFLGENLINKIGIVILLLGVGWGVKYSIDNQLISPVMRIIMGYVAGTALFGLAYYLKKKYENYSAVLLSGSLAMMYFITYFAFSSYAIFGRIPAFALMVLFTVVTVAESLRYNRVIIAHIGLVGAYAVPFLLSDGSGKAYILFTYMAIINAGILFIAFKRYWKSLWYSSIAFTILICFGWLIHRAIPDTTYYGLIYFPLFFAIHLGVYLAFKLYREIPYTTKDHWILYLNSGLYFIAIMFVADEYKHGPLLLTLAWIVIHACIGYGLYRKEQYKELAHQFFGMAFAFLAVLVTVQWDDEWTTIGWALQALMLAALASRTGHAVYRNLFQGIMILTMGSMLYDWSVYYSNSWTGQASRLFPAVTNVHFTANLMSTLLVLASTTIIFKNEALRNTHTSWKHVVLIISTGLAAVISVYGTFYNEILHYWSKMIYGDNWSYSETGNYASINQMLIHYREVWLLNYSLIFAAVLSWLLHRWNANRLVLQVSFIFNLIVLVSFLFVGLYHLSNLRLDYMNQVPYSSHWNLTLRYVSYALIALALWSTHRIAVSAFDKNGRKVFDFALHITCLWLLSSELLHWRELNNSAAADKTGLSILWGAYSLFLIAIGIIQKKSYLRIAALVWLGVTLIKLFFYDLSELNTLSKTIVMVILGVVLLIISFLYNKYKTKIFVDE